MITACVIRAPTFTTTAAAGTNSGVHAGSVDGATRTSPGPRSPRSNGSVRCAPRPRATPAIRLCLGSHSPVASGSTGWSPLPASATERAGAAAGEEERGLEVVEREVGRCAAAQDVGEGWRVDGEVVELGVEQQGDVVVGRSAPPAPPCGGRARRGRPASRSTSLDARRLATLAPRHEAVAAAAAAARNCPGSPRPSARRARP